MQQDQEIARSFRALSHPNRAKLFRLLCGLSGRSASYSRLQAMARMTDATLTHHLRDMERAGLVRRRRRGPHVLYQLDFGALDESMTRVARIGAQKELREDQLAVV